MELARLEELFIEAEEFAQANSSDSETKVGALLYWDSVDHPMTKATNTFVYKAKGLPSTRPDKYQYIIHAETNLIYDAASRGLPIDGSIVICTLSPCQGCIRAMYQSGIREIYYRDTHRDHNPEMLDIKVIEEEFGPYTRMLLTTHD